MAAAMPVPFAVWSLDGMLIKKSVAAHALVKKSIGSVVIKLPLQLMIVKKAANLARATPQYFITKISKVCMFVCCFVCLFELPYTLYQ